MRSLHRGVGGFMKALGRNLKNLNVIPNRNLQMFMGGHEDSKSNNAMLEHSTPPVGMMPFADDSIGLD